MTYDLCDGRKAESSATPVLWWCPNRLEEGRIKVLSVLPPPAIDSTQPLVERNFVANYDKFVSDYDASRR